MASRFMHDNRICIFFKMVLPCAIAMVTSCASGQDHTINQQWLTAERAAIKNAVLLNNEAGSLPLTGLDKKSIASVEMGHGYSALFDSLANKYARADRFPAGPALKSSSLMPFMNSLAQYTTIVIQVTDPSLSDRRILDFITNSAKQKQVIIAYFGAGLRIAALNGLTCPVVWCKEVSEHGASVAAQIIFGGIAAQGRLDKTYSSKFVAGAGFSTAKTRLQYTVPEDENINSDQLIKIDNIAAEAIRQRATPGAVVLVAYNGKVIFNKAYGSFTYDVQHPDGVTDIFDLASVTKVTATTPSVMHLYEAGQIRLDDDLSVYLPEAVNTNKAHIKVKEVMLHQAGFVPYIPFYDRLKPADHSPDSSYAYPTKVADGYYLRRGYYRDLMWPEMVNSHLEKRGTYVYSDLSMYFMKEIVEGLTHTTLDRYVQDQFYRPLGMRTAGFKPRERFARERIVPTEDDTYFRKTLLQGYVHDQGAAMADGVSGHAGLFASANDLAIMYQMLLNKGTYGGVEYFRPETVELFTSRQSPVSRRGLGFDRWDPETSKHYPSQLATSATFGHTGYTGTCVWVDPAYNLVYIFLSNRVYPKVTDTLSHLSIRPRIQDVIYEALNSAGKMPAR